MIEIKDYSFPTTPVETEIATHTIKSVYIPEHESYTVSGSTVNISSKEIISEITEEMLSDATTLIVQEFPENEGSIDSTIILLIVEDQDYLISSEIISVVDIPEITLEDGVDSCKVLSGLYPISLFDQYEVSYVDKGSSDIYQTPEVSKINEVPDGKDVFKVEADPRATMNIEYIVTTKSFLGKEETRSYFHTISQTFNMVKVWIKNYVEIRTNL